MKTLARPLYPLLLASLALGLSFASPTPSHGRMPPPAPLPYEPVDPDGDPDDVFDIAHPSNTGSTTVPATGGQRTNRPSVKLFAPAVGNEGVRGTPGSWVFLIERVLVVVRYLTL